MAKNSLAEYIDSRRKEGVKDHIIKGELVGGGWKEVIVDEALGNNFLYAEGGNTGSIFDLVGGAFDLMGERFWSLAFLMFLPLGAQVFITYELSKMINSTVLRDILLSGGGIWQSIGVWLVALLLVWLLGLWTQVACFWLLAKPGKVRVGEAMKKTFWLVARFWNLSFVSGWVIMGYLCLLVVPGVIYMVWLSLIYFVVVDWGEGVFNSMLISRELVRGKWWYLFFRLVLLGLVWLAFELIRDVLNKAGIQVTMVMGVTVLVDVLLAMFSLCYLAKIYEYLKGRSSLVVNFSRKQRLAFALPGMLFGLVGLAVVAGLVVLSISPTKQIERARMTQRRADLESIQTAVTLYKIDRDSLPVELGELSPTWMRSLPTDFDPEVEYKLVSDVRGYRVCAIKDGQELQCSTVR